MTISTRPDVAELTKLASSLETETRALAARTAKHDSEAEAIARQRDELSKRASTFARIASDSRAHTAKVLAQPAVKVTNGTPKPVAKKAKARKRNRKPIGAPKYRDPDTGKTWTGMGTLPDFIKNSGQPKEHFLIQGQSA